MCNLSRSLSLIVSLCSLFEDLVLRIQPQHLHIYVDANSEFEICKINNELIDKVFKGQLFLICT